MTRSTFRRVSCAVGSNAFCALIVVLSVGVACNSDQSRDAAETAAGGGDLRVVLQSPPVTLNPNIGVDEASLVVGRNLFNQLIALDADQNIIEDLATSWEVSRDGREYIFHLRNGVTWHDGRPFTSADVKWTFEMLRTAGGLAQDTATRIVRIDVPDATTVVFHLATPWAPFLAEIAMFGTYVLPQHAYGGADWQTAAANQKPVGTGPFVFVEWSRPGPIVLAANKRYFRRGPFVDRLFFLPAGPEEIDDLLLQGKADYTVARPPISSLPALEHSDAVTVQSAPSDSRYQIAFNLSREPYGDVRVRRAINIAIDRLRLIDRALAGYGAPAFTFYTPLVEWAHNPQARVGATDVAAARALLDAAGLKPGPAGVRLEATLVVGDLSPFRELAIELRDQLEAIGVKLSVSTLPLPQWVDRVMGRRDFDLTLFAGSQGPDPDNLRVRLTRWNFISYANPHFEQATEEGARATDVGTRARAYFRAQEVLADDQPIAPLAEAVRISVYSRRVTGLPQTEARGLVAPHDFSLVRVKK